MYLPAAPATRLCNVLACRPRDARHERGTVCIRRRPPAHGHAHAGAAAYGARAGPAEAARCADTRQAATRRAGATHTRRDTHGGACVSESAEAHERPSGEAAPDAGAACALPRCPAHALHWLSRRPAAWSCPCYNATAPRRPSPLRPPAAVLLGNLSALHSRTPQAGPSVSVRRAAQGEAGPPRRGYRDRVP